MMKRKSAKTYGLLRSLLSPEQPAGKTLKQIVTPAAFKPQATGHCWKGLDFTNTIRAKNDRISEYCVELSRLSEHGQFGTVLFEEAPPREGSG